MIKYLFVSVLACAVTVAMGTSFVSAQTASPSPTPAATATPTPTATTMPSSAPATGFGTL